GSWGDVCGFPISIRYSLLAIRRSLKERRSKMHHDHDDHDHHDHGDPHAPRKDHDAGPASAYEMLEEAVRTLLIEKGVLTPQEIAASVDLMDSRSPALGAT